MKGTLPNRARFGGFELDLKAGELYRDGQTVLLQEQPLQVLRMLVFNAGKLVTREEIQKKLWPNDTVVEFDHGINTAIQKLRQALGDSADKPSYIQTVARRGYRFIASVERVDSICSDEPVAEAITRGEDETKTKFESSSLTGKAIPQAHVAPAGNLIGKKVSHYRVLEVVGGGGMGVVYKAEDLKLGRRVAMKFLPEELGSDANALERFEREARAASALDHANICAIHEFGEHDRQPFIVMPLLQGQNLRDLISNRAAPFSTEEILRIGIQIASGLEAAHEKGIIHRDIKPANIFLTTGGPVKILDFGLAKLVEAEERSEEQIGAVSVPLFSTDRDLTITGLTMGTAGYMSPEQVRGEKLDAPTDLFSFGLVLYEMATGQRAFSGETAAVVKDAIQNEDLTPLGHINPALPEKLESIVIRAIEKDRERRYQCASDIRLALEWTAERRRAQRGWTRGRRILVSGLAVCFLAVAATLLSRSSKRPDDPSALVVRKL
jgi:serine/threonine protein kinase